MEREGQTSEGRKVPPVLELPSGASTQGYSSFPFSSGLSGEGGCQLQPAEWRMLREHQGDTKNLPPVLVRQDKSADCSPFMQEFPENFTASRHREQCQLQTLQTGSTANSSSKPEPPQNRLSEIPKE